MSERVTLVAGATGGLGFQVCESVVRRGGRLRALIRSGADPAKVARLRELGAELVVGDLENRETLPPVLECASFVITTASAFPSDPRPDAIEQLDRVGNINLVNAAAAAGVRRMVFTSVPRSRPTMSSSKPNVRSSAASAPRGWSTRSSAPTASWRCGSAPCSGLTSTRGRSPCTGRAARLHHGSRRPMSPRSRCGRSRPTPPVTPPWTSAGPRLSHTRTSSPSTRS